MRPAQARTVLTALAAATLALGLGAGLAHGQGPGTAGAARAADDHPPAGHRLLLTGQVMLQHPLATFDADDPDLQRIRHQWQQVFDVVRGADATILELESALQPARPAVGADASAGRARDSDFFHEIDGASVADLIQNRIGFAPGQVMFAGANNHAGDNGAAGIEAMAALFERLRVPLAGIGDEATAAAPRYLTLSPGTSREQRIALLAFATDKIKLPARGAVAGVHTLTVGDDAANTIDAADEQRVYRSIAEARRQRATVVVYQHNHHWNQQQVNAAGGIERWRVDFAHRCVEHGADVYFAHGEPRLQGIEIYKGKPIFYGLGNFVFQTRKRDFYQAEVWQSVMAELEYDDAGPPPRAIRAIKLIPVVLNEDGVAPLYMETRGLPALAKGAQARAILAALQAESAKFGTHIDIDDSRPDAIVGRITLPSLGKISARD